MPVIEARQGEQMETSAEKARVSEDDDEVTLDDVALDEEIGEDEE